MAKAKKSKAKKPAKKKTKKAAKRASAVSRRAPAKKSNKAKAKKAAPRKAAASRKAAAPRKAKKSAPRKKPQLIGEGDYAASRAFQKDEVAFVKKNKAKIPALAKEAAAALDGPEGANLRAAEQEAMNRSTID